MVDAVIASVPWTDTDSPLMAPGVLKSSLNSLGLRSIAIDLNQEFRQRIKNHPNRDSIVKFCLSESVDRQSADAIYEIFTWMVDRILASNPRYIFLSLLTYLSQHPCRWLCWLIRQREPDIKIVIGGAGCFNSLKSVDSFAINLKSLGLIDHFIVGDGEQAIKELVLGNLDYSGIDSLVWQELKNLDSLPLPDYKDYDFSLYKTRSISIWGSRGCVRDCTFCDIHEHWSKFQWRSAESIFSEMCQQYDLYGINIFNFADSLVNGNQKEYRKLIKLLSDFNKDKPDDKKIKWTSFFIFRPASEMDEEDWRLTAESGAMLLMVGVESFVDHIRHHLKKKFSNADLCHGLTMAQKYKVRLNLLLIVGYVTETEQDHQEQLQWIEDNKHFAGNPVIGVNLGSTLAILPGTWLDKNKQDMNIRLASQEVYQDWYRDEIGSTPEIRMRWHREILDALSRNGFQPGYVKDNHVLIENYIKSNADQI